MKLKSELLDSFDSCGSILDLLTLLHRLKLSNAEKLYDLVVDIYNEYCSQCELLVKDCECNRAYRPYASEYDDEASYED